MKRSEINGLVSSAQRCFARHSWTLPPAARWDVTDFGLGEPERCGLVLVNLTTEPEYWEKLMYARKGMVTPCHCHRCKKEDIICRVGQLDLTLWSGVPLEKGSGRLRCKVNGNEHDVSSGTTISLRAGERVTIPPFVYHEFVPRSEECIIGEVSTANDDVHDNVFVDPRIGRYSRVVEDEEPLVRLINE